MDILENLSHSLKSTKNTTAKTIIWCDIFHLFVRRNKKNKTGGRKFPVKHKHLRPYCQSL